MHDDMYVVLRNNNTACVTNVTPSLSALHNHIQLHNNLTVRGAITHHQVRLLPSKMANHLPRRDLTSDVPLQLDDALYGSHGLQVDGYDGGKVGAGGGSCGQVEAAAEDLTPTARGGAQVYDMVDTCKGVRGGWCGFGSGCVGKG
jgi:hypothetical protein